MTGLRSSLSAQRTSGGGLGEPGGSPRGAGDVCRKVDV
jgi:hypothetical protein